MPEEIAKSAPISHSETRTIRQLKYRRNARLHDRDQITLIARSIQRFGWTTPVLVDENDVVLAGYGRIAGAKELGWTDVPVMVARGWSDEEKRAYMLADNQIAARAGWDMSLLKLEMDDLKLLDFDLELIGFPKVELKNLFSIGSLEKPVGSLREQFGLPPFSILDARSGWWQDRRRRWLALGIKSELGRGDNALRFSDTILQPDAKKRARKTSPLDPASSLAP
jgi:ParB-like chromosome segregation protein Spo0J